MRLNYVLIKIILRQISVFCTSRWFGNRSNLSPLLTENFIDKFETVFDSENPFKSNIQY